MQINKYIDYEQKLKADICKDKHAKQKDNTVPENQARYTRILLFLLDRARLTIEQPVFIFIRGRVSLYMSGTANIPLKLLFQVYQLSFSVRSSPV